MILKNILELVNQFEKRPFLNMLDKFCNERGDCSKELSKKVDSIMTEGENQIKNVGEEKLVELFNMFKDQYKNELEFETRYNSSQLDVLIDIITRDGNNIMSREWFLSIQQGNKETPR